MSDLSTPNPQNLNNDAAQTSPAKADEKQNWNWPIFWKQVERGVLLATFVSIIVGVVSFWLEAGERQEARADRRADAITRAWALITTPATGNSGKGPALEYLNGLGIPLEGIDLSCERMGSEFLNDENYRADWAIENQCEAPTYLQGLVLSGAMLWGANFEGANLRGANLEQATLSDADLRRALVGGANLQQAVLVNTNFTGASLVGADFSRATLEFASFEGADLGSANLESAFMRGKNFQGA